MATTESVLTPAAARELLQAEQKGRVDACQAELQAVLDKYRCRLDISVILRAGQVIPQVQVVANE